ncbi:MAG: DUF58 domain-containing protein [Thermoplasmata archaeon]|nr:DUF58 domain-containing protein [Thermoplasmata archaeon]
MIARRGWEAIAAAIASLVIGLYALNPVLELVAVAMAAFVITEMLVFEWRFRDLGPDWFVSTRSQGPRRLPTEGDLATSIEIQYPRGPGFQAEIYDVVPEAFDVVKGATATRTWVAPGASVRLSYTTRPRVRGAFQHGPTVVVARDAFGFCYRATTVRTERPLMVVPPNIAGRLGSLGLALFTRFQSGLSIRRRGYGTEFRALRPYQPSDDIRHVAWKRSTLTNLVVKEFDQESRQEFLLALDLTTAMDAGRWGRNALDVSVEAAALLTHLIARQGEDRIGLLTYADGVFQYVPPGRSPAHLRRIIDNLALAAHRPGECALPAMLSEITRRLRQRTHVFVFTAAQPSLEGLGVAYANLRAHGHRPYIFLPDRSGFYPAPTTDGSGRPMEWAKDEERRRFHGVLASVRAEGIPVFPFDRRGAGDKVLFAYTQIRSWGTVR